MHGVDVCGGRYNSDLEGVLISFDNVRIPQGIGYIVDELPFIRVHIEFEVCEPVSPPLCGRVRVWAGV